MTTLLVRPFLLLLTGLLLALLATPAPTQTRARKAPATTTVEDQLPSGRTWRGTDDSGAPVTIRVVARNVNARTATLRITASNGWTFDVDVTTSPGGSTFQVANARRVDQRVRITRESGGGRASGSEIALGLSWTYDRGNRHGQAAKKVNGRR